MPIVDATAAASTFETFMSDTQSFDWRWSLVGGDVRLIQGGVARYKSHRLSITASDPNVYVLDTGGSDLPRAAGGVDHLGYTTSGWHLLDSGTGATLVNTSGAGPAGYLASQLTLDSPAVAAASMANPASLATLQSTCIRVAPADLFWISCWLNIVKGGNGKLTARFYDLAGSQLPESVVADSGSIGAHAWKHVEGPLHVPANAAYMAPAITASASTVQFTDLRVRRAT
jgi:hypothetical protein